ncbi:MAG: PTS sugar transporter subunit IIA [Rhodopila sp.]
MEMADFLTPDRVLLDVRARDKAQLIAEIARNFARSVPSVEAGAVEGALLAREELGSTGLGGGFALPHAQIEDLEGYLGLFLRLAKPIDFRAVDGNPVGVVFALLTPAQLAVSHVSVLATISRRFRDSGLVEKLHEVKSPGDAYTLLIEGYSTAQVG